VIIRRACLAYKIASEGQSSRPNGRATSQAIPAARPWLRLGLSPRYRGAIVPDDGIQGSD